MQIITKDIYGNAVARADKFVTKIRGDTNILEEESKLTFVDISEALYKLSYQVSQPGQYLMDIGLAGGNGLLGEYYTNRFLSGEPAATKIDNFIDFNWGYGPVADQPPDYVSIRWTGYIWFPHTGSFELELTNVDDRALLWIDGSLILDTHGHSKGIFHSIDNYLYDIRVEYFEVSRGIMSTANLRTCIIE
mmetsp:Transcript_23802/g.35139  ORF Transcript_23802/g.35139 Transcript_23802/m.35139 type:complete len:191 (-) Transcript_23802:807-1379(-)